MGFRVTLLLITKLQVIYFFIPWDFVIPKQTFSKKNFVHKKIVGWQLPRPAVLDSNYICLPVKNWHKFLNSKFCTKISDTTKKMSFGETAEVVQGLELLSAAARSPVKVLETNLEETEKMLLEFPNLAPKPAELEETSVSNKELETEDFPVDGLLSVENPPTVNKHIKWTESDDRLLNAGIRGNFFFCKKAVKILDIFINKKLFSLLYL